MNLRIGIAGQLGRMGRLLGEEVEAAGLTLVGGYGRAGPGDLPARVDVLIDFTHADAAERHAHAVAEAGCAWVLGTSGLSPAQEAAVAEAARRVPVVHAANFSPGVTLVLELARRMAAALPAADYDAEITEMHHRQKVDAPSGTAVAIGRAVALGRGVAFEQARLPAREGHGDARPTGGIGFAALRGGQVVGEHTLLFAGATEHVALTHRAFDRRAFAAGAVRAAAWTRGRPPGLYGMPDVLGLA